MESLLVNQETTEDSLVLHLVGPLNLNHVPAFKQGFEQAWRRNPRRILVELSGSPCLDSAGVARPPYQQSLRTLAEARWPGGRAVAAASSS